MSRRRRVLLWVGVLVALGFVGAWLAAQCLPNAERKFARVRVGMSNVEAAAVLRHHFSHAPSRDLSGDCSWYYGTDDYQLYIETRGGVVMGTSFEWRIPILARLRRWLGL